jgi:hypothetical protein
MTPRRALKAKRKLDKRVHPQAKSIAIDVSVEADPDKVRVLAYFRGLVTDGLAERQAQDDGTVRLTLSTGEMFLLKKTSVTRIA